MLHAFTHHAPPQVVGLGWPNYWKVTWNKFDCVLLVTGLVDMFLTLLVGECVVGRVAGFSCACRSCSTSPQADSFRLVFCACT